MAPKLLKRWVPRGFTSALVWAMVPLAIISGAPVSRCGCFNCYRGAACAADASPVAGCCHAARFTLRDKENENGSAPAAGVPSSPQSCCGDRNPDACKHGNGGATGKGPSDRPQRCQTLLAIRPAALQTAVSAPDGNPIVAMHLLPIQPAASLPQAPDRILRIGTNPPIDLIVTLRHLLI